jgi:protein dithiol oxidoreductase (disulfide-forming)
VLSILWIKSNNKESYDTPPRTKEAFMRKLVALLGLIFSVNVFAADYLEGQHYNLLASPVPVADKSKVEVVELFSYHCSHCFHFEPLLETWKKKQASDVVLVQMPAYWNAQMEPWVRGYYTAQVLGIKDKTHGPVFKAFQVEKKYFNRALDWANFYADYGVTVETVVKTYNSFGVTSLYKQAETRLRNNYKASGTPELFVQGKYRVSMNDDVKTQEDMLKVADFLIEQERKLLKK